MPTAIVFPIRLRRKTSTYDLMLHRLDIDQLVAEHVFDVAVRLALQTLQVPFGVLDQTFDLAVVFHFEFLDRVVEGYYLLGLLLSLNSQVRNLNLQLVFLVGELVNLLVQAVFR